MNEEYEDNRFRPEVSMFDDGYNDGFQDGLRHAAELAKEAKPNQKGLSRDEWIAVELTHDAVVKAIYNGLSN